MEIRKLLRSYGIRNFNLPNHNQIMVRIKREQRLPIFFNYVLLSSPLLHFADID